MSLLYAGWAYALYEPCSAETRSTRRMRSSVPRMDQRSTSDPSDLRTLGSRVAAQRKRLALSLRDASAVIGISFNTLARVERGHLPDLENFRRLQQWLGDPMTAESPGELRMEPTSTPEAIAEHLRTDPLLPVDAADRIAAIVRDLYDALAARPSTAPLHLRAARTFTPPAAEGLADLLTRMQAGLLRHP